MSVQKMVGLKVVAALASTVLTWNTVVAQTTTKMAGASKARWVIGSGVNLREQANLTAPVLARMTLNTTVNLVAKVPNSKYCEIDLIVNGQVTQRGFTACEFLSASAIKPREVANQYLEDDKTPNPNYNPERAFWLKPSYQALAEYGRYLERQRHAPKDEAEGVFLADRPKIPEFERMKEHLAKGVLVSKPEPYKRWVDIKTAVQNLEVDRLKVIKKHGSIDNLSSSEFFGSSLVKRSNNLIETMGIRTLDGVQGMSGLFVPPKLPTFIESLELPTITNSYFQSQDEIAAPTGGSTEVAARFQIIQTVKTRSYDALPAKSKRNRDWFGLWDVAEVSQALTQSVIKNTLSRAGEDIHSETTHLRSTFIEYGNDEGAMCEWYEGDGFSFGDADPKIAISYARLGRNSESLQPKKMEKKLMYFYTKQPLPQKTTSVNVVKQKLNRAKTGFVSATEFHFDINSDGISDILVWEGTGIGPGHMDGPTKTDDAWYRIFFVNIAGQWHLLGTDSYSYGCGC